MNFKKILTKSILLFSFNISLKVKKWLCQNSICESIYIKIYYSSSQSSALSLSVITQKSDDY